MGGLKKSDSYHDRLCTKCGKYFHGFNGLNLHNATSRCGRIVRNELSDNDKTMIAKYPGKYKVVK